MCWALRQWEFLFGYNEGFRMRSKSEASLAYEALLTKWALHSSHKSLNTRKLNQMRYSFISILLTKRLGPEERLKMPQVPGV